MGTPDSFLIGSREADVAGAQSALEVRVMNDAHVGCRSAIPLWTPACLGLRAKESACPGSHPFWPDVMFGHQRLPSMSNPRSPQSPKLPEPKGGARRRHISS